MRTAILFGILAASLAAQDAAEILSQNCLACHGSAAMSGLDLRTRASMLKGGTRGAAIVPGKAEASRLYRFVAGLDQPVMPPAGKLPPEKLAAIKKWIESGAPELALTQAAPKKYWAFVKPVAKEYPGNAIDHAWPVGKAIDQRTLIRRAYLDLHGLPPTPAEVEAFVNDRDPKAYEKLIDRLLAAPQYGERWARHWLDLARFADSAGYEFDRDRPHAWRYRDYVIQALNQDKPYDRFIQEQIAGDELWPESKEAHIATGFLRNGPEANIKTDETRLDELDDLIATTSGAFLGLTAGCARCHDHKFDPIPQKDYFRLQSVYWNTKYNDLPLVDSAEIDRIKAEQKKFDDLTRPLKRELSALEKPYVDRLQKEKFDALPDYIKAALNTPAEKRTEGQRLQALQIEKAFKVDPMTLKAALSEADRAKQAELQAQIEKIEEKRPLIPSAMAIANGGQLSKHPAGAFGALGGGEFNSGDRVRTELARWIASPENPLTARVMVNRVFLQHFGEGFVDTPSNFGKSGSGVKKQDLLDTLAVEFMRDGWSLKNLHKRIMLSKAYQGELRPRRLEAEALRDSVLAVAGSLDRTSGGPGIYPYIDPRLWQASSGRKWPGRPDEDPATWRRSVYIFTKRTIPVPLMEVYDKPDTQQGSCSRRNRSTTSTQALIMMNSSFIEVQSKRFAERLKQEAGADPVRQIARAFALALGRAPSPKEAAASLAFLQSGDPNALADFCQTVFNLNEFAYVP